MSRFKMPERMNIFDREVSITKFWKENKIFERSVDERPDDDRFVFVDGPPFVSGMPHYGHLLTSMAKDVIPRFWTMKGKKVRRVWGWDCHGLPIEAKVNKLMGITSREQIEKEVGVAEYVSACRKYVEQNIADWRWYIDRIGRWVDLDNAYHTMYPEYNESVIWAFKQMWEKGLVYKGKRVSLFSTDTSTPVSNFEVAMDADNYKETEDLSIFVKFKIVSSPAGLSADEEEGEVVGSEAGEQRGGRSLSELTGGKPVYLVAWTTTPWTIPANFALAVNPEMDYSLVKFQSEYYVVAKGRLDYTFELDKEENVVETVSEFKGVELKGLEYEPAYDFFVESKTENDFHVYLSEDVTSDEGTGVLHVAPGFGEVDFNMGQEFGLSDKNHINERGELQFGPWKGEYIRDASKPITEDLEKQGKLLRSEMYMHKLPYYRGDNPLIYMAQDAYFLDVQSIKKRMLELNEEVNWVPDHIKYGRFANTIETSPDWCISRNRYWATIMPIWMNEGGDQIVVGSFDEMMEYTDEIEKKKEDGKDVYYFQGEEMRLHRDVCDKVVLTKDGKKYHRVPEVLDVWLDSGSVPFAEYHYPFENKEVFERGFPADFILEYVGQVRAWFTVLFRVSTILFDRTPFKNVVCHGVMAGDDGRKMSKSYGNYPDPKEVLEKFGADSLRYVFMGSPIMVGGDTDASIIESGCDEMTKKVWLPFWNSVRFLTIYAQMHNWEPSEGAPLTLARRLPAGEEGRGGRGDEGGLNVLDRWILTRTDQLTQDVEKALEEYDMPSAVREIAPYIEDLSTWYIRRSRDRFAAKDENALETLYHVLMQSNKAMAPFIPFLTESVHQVLKMDKNEDSVHLELWPETKEIDEELLLTMKELRRVVYLGQSARAEGKMKVRQPLEVLQVSGLELSDELVEILKDELNVKSVEIVEKVDDGDDWVVKDELNLKASLKVTLTDELKQEGLYRELVRMIQDLRKKEGLKMGEKVRLYWQSDAEDIVRVFSEMDKELSKAVGASELVNEKIEGMKEKKVNDYSVKLKINK